MLNYFEPQNHRKNSTGRSDPVERPVLPSSTPGVMSASHDVEPAGTGTLRTQALVQQGSPSEIAE